MSNCLDTSAELPTKKHKKTRKRRKKPKQTEDMDKLGVMEVAALAGTVVGDLTEFGVTSSTMAVELAPEEVPPALQTTSSSLPPATATSRTPVAGAPAAGSVDAPGVAAPPPLAETIRNMERNLQARKEELAGATGQRRAQLQRAAADLEKRLGKVRLRSAGAG